MEALQEPRVPAHNGPLNILLLGASGVGKSTFINAFCNYFIYRSLDDAVKGEPQSLIYCEFQERMRDSSGRLSTKKIVVGKPDFDEGGASLQAGASCTQRCKAYTLPVGECGEIRLIDTPGILDTRGVDANAENMKHILAFLAGYEVLHAVCILLRPNEVRLTNSLKYSIVQLLEKLHKDASRNILFCFTNSRSTRYRVGSTLPLLENMLKDIKVNIDLRSESSMYFFDSEAFRFQAIVKQGGDYDEEDYRDYERSWNKSAEEASRLISHILTLEPHRLKDTLSLNRIRSMLESIQKPLGDLTKNIQDNLQQMKKTREELQKGRGDVSSYSNKLFIVEAYQETVPLDHPQTVCTVKKCEGRVCHEKCSPTETALGMFENVEGMIVDKVSRLSLSYAGFNVSGLLDPESKVIRKLTGSTDDAVFCTKLSYSSGKCRVCECPNSRHIRVNTKMEPATRTIRDENIQKVLDDTDSTMDKKESILKILERKEEAMRDENTVVVEAAALFAGFLEQNSIVTYHSAISDYYKEEKMKMKREGNSERAQELDGFLQLYEKNVYFFNDVFRKKSTRITEAMVNEQLQKLHKLELHDPKNWMDGIESAAVFEENQAKAKGKTVQEPRVPAHNGPLNILLLGALGVGKSTFINAFRNYFIYPSLDEAVKGELQSLIYCEFEDSNRDSSGHLSTKKIVVGKKPDTGEGGASLQAGASCTQRCKAYTIPVEEYGGIRLIDTPGFLETRGVDANAENMKHILAFLAGYEVLHAVCILLRPNEVRLTNSLKYSIVQLLEKLHKDALRNILFCFTNSRSTRYRPGHTVPLLEEMLEDIKVNIDLRSKSNMYFFDSEAFRFQAIVNQGGDYDEEDLRDYQRSWNKSAEEASRLISHISTLEPHCLKDTLSVHRVRSMLESIQKLLGYLAANIQDNLQQMKKTREELQKLRSDVSNYLPKLFIVEAYQETVPLDHPKMVCTVKKCDRSVCECPNSRYIRVNTKMVPATRTIRDENIQKMLDDTTSTMDKKERILEILQRKEEAQRDENTVLVEAAALFADFLEQNSIVTYHSAISDYYKEEKMKMKREGNSERAQELDGFLQLYEEKLNFFTDVCRVKCTDITEAMVNEQLQKLYKLELHGPELKNWMDGIESAAAFEENQAKAQGEVVYKAPVLPFNNAAGVHDGTRPKGLRESIAQKWRSGAHILK